MRAILVLLLFPSISAASAETVECSARPEVSLAGQSVHEALLDKHIGTTPDVVLSGDPCTYFYRDNEQKFFVVQSSQSSLHTTILSLPPPVDDDQTTVQYLADGLKQFGETLQTLASRSDSENLGLVLQEHQRWVDELDKLQSSIR